MNSTDWIDVTTEKNHYSLDHFVIPNHYEQDVSSILIPHGVIMVSFLGETNTTRGRGERVILIVIYNRIEFRN